jgi:magnesium chelatase family protein
MLARTFTAMLIGLKPVKIEVEVDGNRGLPNLIFIGLTSKATEEAKQRITSALQNCGVRIRSKRTVVNLAPADVPKTSSCFDLAIAIGVLKMYGEISVNTDDTMFFGELALDGTVKHIHGALPLVLAAKSLGYQHVVIPHSVVDEIAIVTGIQIHPIAHLKEYFAWAKHEYELPVLPPRSFAEMPAEYWGSAPLIFGQSQAKRSLMICAAGGHHLLMTGSPGIGKSLLAQSLIHLLPPLTEQEAIEVTNMYSICGLATGGLIRRRPFRSPHHSISLGGLIGGGPSLRPGEISLAHRGVLFLDELLEFSRSSLEALRQPMEEGTITLARAAGASHYPCAFTLVAAMNPCPCGYALSQKKACRCSPHTIELYQKKLSGPLLDRFDLRVQVEEFDIENLNKNQNVNEKQYSHDAAENISKARKVQQERYQNSSHFTNADIPADETLQYCTLTPQAQTLLHHATKKLKLSGRSYFKLIKVSRTIADLESAQIIEEHHIAEALQYR